MNRNFFKLYRKPERTNTDIAYNITITILTIGVLAYCVAWVTRFVFGYGRSALVK